MIKYNTVTSFFVSEKTRIYYHADSILKTVKAEEERDIWYFRVREMASDYEINVDPDLANKDALTIFINHRVYDYQGNYIGAIGVGLTIHAVINLIDNYRQKYNSNIYFADSKGKIIVRSNFATEDASTIYNMEGLSALADGILSLENNKYQYSRSGQLVHLNTRFVPELNWYLLVEQMEGDAVGEIYGTLVVNLILCAFITVVVIFLTTLTINSFQKLTLRQQEVIVKSHQELFDKNTSLEKALAEVKTLSGFLPICASCKKIRDDQGYWQQIESYIGAHSQAEFTHGICPECAKRLYPEFMDKKQSDDTEERT